jgi:hypothetical protein
MARNPAPTSALLGREPSPITLSAATGPHTQEQRGAATPRPRLGPSQAPSCNVGGLFFCGPDIGQPNPRQRCRTGGCAGRTQ